MAGEALLFVPLRIQTGVRPIIYCFLFCGMCVCAHECMFC